MAEDQFNLIFSALSHPLRRSIVEKLAATGPQTYTALLQEFKLETGTLNYHLEKMKAFLEQDGEGRYQLTRQGFSAHSVLTYLRNEVDKPYVPPPPKAVPGWKPKLGAKITAWGMLIWHSLPFQAVLRPATYMKRVKLYPRMGPAVGIVFLAWFVLTAGGDVPLMYEFLVTEVLWFLLGFGFLLSIYGKRPNFLQFIAALGAVYIPLLLLRGVTLYYGVPGVATQVVAFAAFIFFAWFLASFFFAIKVTSNTTTREAIVVLVLIVLARIALSFLSPSLYPFGPPWLS